MKYNVDDLHLCTDNELYNALLPLTEKVYNQYSYVNIEQSCYKKIVMDSIKESRKILNNSNTYTFDILFLDCLQNNINEYIKTLLPNQTEAIILGFIETNIKCFNTDKDVIKEFQKLVDFMQNIDFLSSLDYSNILLLFERYKCIEDMVKQIVDTNIESIKKSGIDNTFKNSVLTSFVEVYCLTHNIEIYDDKLISNEFLQASDSSFYDYKDDEYNDDSYNGNNDDYNSLTIYLKESCKNPLLSEDEEKELFVKFAQGDKKARKKLIDSNLRLVVCIAKKFRESGLPFLDLIQEGNLGLIEAVDHFDITKDCKFSTYAYYWIYVKIIRFIQEKSSCIRIPVYKCIQLQQYKNLKANLICQSNSKLSIQEIAEKMNIPVAKVNELEQIKPIIVSMNSLITENDDTELGDLISDAEVDVENTVIKAIESTEMKHLITNSNLDLKEIKVLTLRYGLNGEEPKTLKQIGQRLNLSWERIGQIEFKALRKLRISIKKGIVQSKNNYQSISCNQKSNEQKTTKDSKIFELNRRKGNILKIVHDYFANRYIKYTQKQIDRAFRIVLDMDSMRYFFKDYLYNFEKSSDLDEKTNKIIKERLIPEISRYLSKNTRLELKTDVIDNQYIKKIK